MQSDTRRSDGPTSLDHVALWVADPGKLANALCEGLGMHVIERTDAFTLVGVDALLGKLTLFAAEGPRNAGVLDSVVLRVHDVPRVIERLPSELRVVTAGEGEARLEAPEGLAIGLVEGRSDQVAYDLDHVVLRVPDPDAAALRLAAMGFERRDGRLAVGDRHVRVLGAQPDGAQPDGDRPADGDRPVDGAQPADGDRPLLNHLALLVDSVDDYLAGEHGLEVDEIRDAANTYAAFVWGPDRIKLEYLEHKPGFSLV
jgi:catechol 2,3-dioxygenase-like lactoylglutathione lyase family enzyme